MAHVPSFDYAATLSHLVKVLYQQHQDQHSHSHSHDSDNECCDEGHSHDSDDECSDEGHSHGGHSHSHKHNPFSHLPSSELRGILHQLLCIRSPDIAMNESLLNECDMLLSYEQSKRQVVDGNHIPRITDVIKQQHPILSHISVWRGDITTLRATAIVNAANEQLLGCFQPSHRCIDNVIHSVAGPRLRAACYDIMSQQGHPEPVGHAKITPGFILPASYVIHTVGPNLNEGKRKSNEPTTEECTQLASCYRSSLDTLLTITPTPSPLTIAFPCISTGLFGFPADQAVEIAMTSGMTWLQLHSHDNVHVIFNVFTDKDEQLYWKYISRLTGVTNIAIPRPLTVSSLSSQLASSWFNDADAVVISAGAGMSAAAGLDYNDTELFARLFPAMAKRGHRCMYEFIGYRGWTPALQWGYLLSQVKLARYEWPHHDVYQSLLNLVTQHQIDYFVHTSNADGMFEQNGFPSSRIFTTQGDYSHIQCLKPCSPTSRWPTRPFIDRALPYINQETQEITNPEVIPTCANCGGPVRFQVRGGDWFMEHTFHAQRAVYRTWLQNHIKQGHRVVIVEIGAGFNTPMVLRWPSERMAADHENVKLIRINEGEDHAKVPVELDQTRAVGLRGNATELVLALCHSYKSVHDHSNDLSATSADSSSSSTLSPTPAASTSPSTSN